jgi:ribosomal protein L29
MAKKKVTKTGSEVKIQDMSVSELAARAKQLTTEISKKKLEKVVGRLKNTREIFNLRKELARIKTIINLKSETAI